MALLNPEKKKEEIVPAKPNLSQERKCMPRNTKKKKTQNQRRQIWSLRTLSQMKKRKKSRVIGVIQCSELDPTQTALIPELSSLTKIKLLIIMPQSHRAKQKNFFSCPRVFCGE